MKFVSVFVRARVFLPHPFDRDLGGSKSDPHMVHFTAWWFMWIKLIHHQAILWPKSAEILARGEFREFHKELWGWA